MIGGKVFSEGEIRGGKGESQPETVQVGTKPGGRDVGGGITIELSNKGPIQVNLLTEGERNHS